MRRLHLRGRSNIAKRVLIHAAGFNIALLMRVRYGLRKPRSMADAGGAIVLTLLRGVRSIGHALTAAMTSSARHLSTAGRPTLRYAA